MSAPTISLDQFKECIRFSSYFFVSNCEFTPVRLGIVMCLLEAEIPITVEEIIIKTKIPCSSIRNLFRKLRSEKYLMLCCGPAYLLTEKGREKFKNLPTQLYSNYETYVS